MQIYLSTWYIYYICGNLDDILADYNLLHSLLFSQRDLLSSMVGWFSAQLVNCYDTRSSIFTGRQVTKFSSTFPQLFLSFYLLSVKCDSKQRCTKTHCKGMVSCLSLLYINGQEIVPPPTLTHTVMRLCMNTLCDEKSLHYSSVPLQYLKSLNIFLSPTMHTNKCTA